MAETEQEQLETETPVTVPAAPGSTKSGQHAVWDHDLGQFVSGVSSKADAQKALKSLKADKAEHGGLPIHEHKLEVLEV